MVTRIRVVAMEVGRSGGILDIFERQDQQDL